MYKRYRVTVQKRERRAVWIKGEKDELPQAEEHIQTRHAWPPRGARRRVQLPLRGDPGLAPPALTTREVLAAGRRPHADRAHKVSPTHATKKVLTANQARMEMIASKLEQQNRTPRSRQKRKSASAKSGRLLKRCRLSRGNAGTPCCGQC